MYLFFRLNSDLGNKPFRREFNTENIAQPNRVKTLHSEISKGQGHFHTGRMSEWKVGQKCTLH